MAATLVNLGMVLLGSMLGVYLQKKLSATVQNRLFPLVSFFIMAIGIHIFFYYHKAALVLVSLALGALLGIWLKVPEKIGKLGTIFLKILLDKKIFFPSPSPFSEGFVTTGLLFCVGSFAILGGFGAGSFHGLWSIRLAMTFLPAVVLAATLGWGVLFSILPVLLVQVFMSLSGEPVQSFFSEGVVGDLTGVGGILIALCGLKLSKLTTVDPSDFLPALLVSPFVSWAYYSLLHG